MTGSANATTQRSDFESTIAQPVSKPFARLPGIEVLTRYHSIFAFLFFGASQLFTLSSLAAQDKQTPSAEIKADLPTGLSLEKVIGPDSRGNPFDLPEMELSPGAAYSAFQRGYYLTAFDLATKLAGLGVTSAQTLLGELYLSGQGVPKDAKQAADWYALAASDGDPEAQFALGLLHIQGQGVKKDIKQAAELFEKAAANGQKKAQFNLAMLYMQGQVVRQDFKKALDLFHKSAEQGMPEAQYALANLYRSDYFPAPDIKKSIHWMHQAAKGGFTDAQLEYGLMLFKGNDLPKDLAAGRVWIERAALAGHVIAQNRLARILAQGFGAPPEPIKAAQYYLQSKRAGKIDDWLEAFFQGLSAKEKEAALRAISDQSIW